MTAVEFDGANLRIEFEGVPVDFPGNTYIPAMMGFGVNGEPQVIVAFKPSVEDLQAFNEGRALFMRIRSHTPPLIGIYTFNEQGEING